MPIRPSNYDIANSPGFVVIDPGTRKVGKSPRRALGATTVYATALRLASEHLSQYGFDAEIWPSLTVTDEEVKRSTVAIESVSVQYDFDKLETSTALDLTNNANLLEALGAEAFSEAQQIAALQAAAEGSLTNEQLLALGWIEEIHGPLPGGDPPEGPPVPGQRVTYTDENGGPVEGWLVINHGDEEEDPDEWLLITDVAGVFLVLPPLETWMPPQSIETAPTQPSIPVEIMVAFLEALNDEGGGGGGVTHGDYVLWDSADLLTGHFGWYFQEQQGPIGIITWDGFVATRIYANPNLDIAGGPSPEVDPGAPFDVQAELNRAFHGDSCTWETNPDVGPVSGWYFETLSDRGVLGPEPALTETYEIGLSGEPFVDALEGRVEPTAGVSAQLGVLAMQP